MYVILGVRIFFRYISSTVRSFVWQFIYFSQIGNSKFSRSGIVSRNCIVADDKIENLQRSNTNRRQLEGYECLCGRWQLAGWNKSRRREKEKRKKQKGKEKKKMISLGVGGSREIGTVVYEQHTQRWSGWGGRGRNDD